MTLDNNLPNIFPRVQVLHAIHVSINLPQNPVSFIRSLERQITHPNKFLRVVDNPLDRLGFP